MSPNKKPKRLLNPSKARKWSSPFPQVGISVENNVVKGYFIVINDKGLHTRPSTELVKCAATFKSEVNLIYHNLVVNAKSLLGILTLGAPRGSCIKVTAEGEDARQAIETIIQLAQNKFYINY